MSKDLSNMGRLGWHFSFLRLRVRDFLTPPKFQRIYSKKLKFLLKILCLKKNLLNYHWGIQTIAGVAFLNLKFGDKETTDFGHACCCMKEKMKFVVFLTLAIFIVELVPGNLKLSKVETVLKKVEGAEHLYKLHLWSISSKDLALFRQIMIRDLSTHFARNIIN